MQKDDQAWRSAENAKELGYKYSSLGEDKRQFNFTHGDVNGDGVLSEEELNAWNESQKKSGSDSDKDGYSKLTNTEYNAVSKVYVEAGGGKAGEIAVDRYLESIGKNNLSQEANDALLENLKALTIPFENQTWTISNDTKNGGFLFFKGEDHNDVYTDVNGNTKTYDELKAEINASDMSDEDKKKHLNALRKQSKK